MQLDGYFWSAPALRVSTLRLIRKLVHYSLDRLEGGLLAFEHAHFQS
jgi:hypothetical protein